MNTRLAVPALALVLALTALPAAAGSLRCGTQLVKEGDLKPSVLAKCGEPEVRERISGDDERRVEQWVYRPGEHRFVRVLTFEGLRLTSIEVIARD